METAEQEFVSHEVLIESCRRQLIEQKDMICEEGQYFLTEKGAMKVRKEFQRYEMRPAMLVLIETAILQKHGLIVE